jgi:fructose/tagatose bisphosphate aldolase
MNIKKIDDLAWQVAFGTKKEKKKTFLKIRELAESQGIRPASINDFYMARGRGEVPLDFTVPAINIRGLAYDLSRSIFKVAISKKVGALVFELARSEMGYTKQPPVEYASVVMAAGLREGFKGPLFLLGDHFQVKQGDRPGEVKEGEVEKVKQLIKDSIEAGLYNIDLDISTLVDYSQKTIDEQQRTNYLLSAELAEYVRSLEPKGVTVSLGGEIGHIGGKNSTEEELHAFMEGFNLALPLGLVGLSKLAIQTGTHHGGVVLPSGKLADVDVDFATLKRLSQVARKYSMGGAVQHGASTLPDKYFSQFPKSEAIEVHLATGFQNMIMDHPKFPKKLLKKMYAWLDSELAGERQEGQTAEQFHYKLRKKAWGQFKKEGWSLSEKIKAPIRADLEKRFAFIFKELNVENTKETVEKFVK